MKNYKHIAILFSLIFILSGCAPQGTSNSKKADVSSASWMVEDGAKEITVAAIDLNGIYSNAASKFEKETGVKVRIINYLDENLTQEEVYKNLEGEVMSNKGTDIFASADWYNFDYKRYGRKKYFCDLKDWISQDSYFKEKYHQNILTSGMDEGKVYAIPLQFYIDILMAPNDIQEIRKLKNLTWEQFMNTGKGLITNGKIINVYDFDIFENRVRAREHDFIDEESKTQKLDSKEMMDLLMQCKEWGDQNQCYSSSSIKNGVITSSHDALLNWSSGDESVYCLFDMPVQGYYYPMPSDFTENRLESNIKALDFVAVSEESKHKATSWKFIKFLLGEEMQSSMLFFPVNQAAMQKRIDRIFNHVKERFSIKFDSEEKKKAITGIFHSIGKVSTRSAYVQIILKEAKRYFKNEITAEQAANEMAQKVERYFKE